MTIEERIKMAFGQLLLDNLRLGTTVEGLEKENERLRNTPVCEGVSGGVEEVRQAVEVEEKPGRPRRIHPRTQD